MGIWIEFRCEGRCDDGAAPHPYGTNAHFRCMSSDNNGPMDMAFDTVASVVETLSELSAVARKTGWKRLKDGWTCPRCIARRAALPLQSSQG